MKVRRWCLGLEKITKGPIYPVDWIDVKCSSYPIYFIQCIKHCGGLTGTNFNHLKNNQQERRNERRNILVSRSPTTKNFTLKTSKRRRLLNVSSQIKLRRNKARSKPIHFIQWTKHCGGLTGTNFNHLKDIRQKRGNEQRNILVSRSPTTKSFTLKLQNVEDFWTFLLR